MGTALTGEQISPRRFRPAEHGLLLDCDGWTSWNREKMPSSVTVNATAMVGAARRLVKKRVEGVSSRFRFRFRFRNRQSAGPQRGRRPGPASLDQLAAIHSPGSGWQGWNLSYARLVESTPSLAGTAGLWGFISTDQLLPDLDGVWQTVSFQRPLRSPVERFRVAALIATLRYCASANPGNLVCHGPFLKLKINVCSLYSGQHPELTMWTRLLTLGSPLPENGARHTLGSAHPFPRCTTVSSGEWTLHPRYRPGHPRWGACH